MPSYVVCYIKDLFTLHTNTMRFNQEYELKDELFPDVFMQ